MKGIIVSTATAGILAKKENLLRCVFHFVFCKFFRILERDYRSPRCRGHPCKKKKTCYAAFSIFVFCKFFRMQAFKYLQKTKITKQSFAILLRRERDSNPRYSKEYNGFRDRPIRPLWHLSLRGQTKFVSMLRCGGERGIRTPGTLASSTVFKTAAFDHSAISPSAAKVLQFNFSANLFPVFLSHSEPFNFQNITHRKMTI